MELPPLDFPPILDEIRTALPGGASAWLVGGAVRDALLNRRTRDLDFAVAGDGVAVGRAVAAKLGAIFYPLDTEHGVGRVIAERAGERFTVDFASLRVDDLTGDLQARDFTINALALNVAQPETLIDPTGGFRDLRAKLIRVCAPDALARDPLRTVRAVRLAAELEFRLDRPTRELVRQTAGRLPEAAAERRRDELFHCLNGPRPAAALRALEALGLLPHLLPELLPLKGLALPAPHSVDAWEHTLLVLARLREVLAVLHPVYNVDVASDLTLGLVSLRLGRHRQALGEHLGRSLTDERPVGGLLLLATALHEIGRVGTTATELTAAAETGSEQAMTRLVALRFSTDEVRQVATLVRHHLAVWRLAEAGDLSRRAIYRYYRELGDAGVEVVLLALADFLGTYHAGPPPVEPWNRLLDAAVALLNAYYERPEEVVRPPALLTGRDLTAELGLAPGPVIGELLEAVREGQAAGEVHDREAALRLARAWLARKR